MVEFSNAWLLRLAESREVFSNAWLLRLYEMLVIYDMTYIVIGGLALSTTILMPRYEFHRALALASDSYSYTYSYSYSCSSSPRRRAPGPGRLLRGLAAALPLLYQPRQGQPPPADGARGGGGRGHAHGPRLDRA